MDRVAQALAKAFLVVCAFFLWDGQVAHAATTAQAPGVMHCGSVKRAYHDFDGDCQSDLLWIKSYSTLDPAQQFGYWLMHGNTRAGSGIVNVTSNPGGYYFGAVGDFNDDGRADVIWLDPSQSNDYEVVRMWLNTGAAYADTAIGTAPRGWALIGAGDINGDGIDDLVWLNAQTCQVAFWFMGPSGRTGSRTQTIACNYRVRVVVRPDSGIADLIWQGYNAATSNQDYYLWRNDGKGNFTSSLFGSLGAGAPMQLLTMGTTADSPFAFTFCMNAGEPCDANIQCTGPACNPPPIQHNGLLVWSPLTSPAHTYTSVAYYNFDYSVGSTGNFWNSPAGTENDLVWVGIQNDTDPNGTYPVYIWRISTLNASVSTYYVDTAPNNWALLP